MDDEATSNDKQDADEIDSVNVKSKKNNCKVRKDFKKCK